MSVRQVMRWASASATARGSSHERSGTVNQDAVAVGERPTARVVAVADGHGSSSHVRSDVGSKLAVELACELGGRAADDGLLDRPRHLIAEHLIDQIVPALVSGWRDRVVADVANEPWTVADLDRSSQLTNDPYHGYGTTLMVAIAGDRTVAILQLGDGDVVVGRASGAIAQPMPGDDRLIGNQTTSMCLPTAVDDFRVAVVEIDDDPIRFVSLTTDGYANAFVSADWSTEVGRDLLHHLDQNGLDWVQGRLHDWLSESASVGGDDVTMGLLVADTVEVEVEVEAPSRDLRLGEEQTAVMPGSGPVRDLATADVEATTLRPVRKRRVLRPMVLLPLAGLIAAGGAAVAIVLLL